MRITVDWQTDLIIDFGGGVRTDNDIEIAFSSGANQVTGGSIAVKEPELFEGWLEKYGSEKIILGADAKAGKIAINGWEEGTELGTIDFIQQYTKKGIQYAICTDIEKDGMQQGPSFQLYQDILNQIPSLQLIASGGVSSMDDLRKLDEAGLYGAIVGKAIYEGSISLQELAAFA